MGGIIHKILSACVKIKVKIQRGSASKTTPLLLLEEEEEEEGRMSGDRF